MAYCFRTLNNGQIEVANFEEGKQPESVYHLKYTASKNHWHCNCPGFYRQANKDEHKHIVLAKFWLENLEGKPGFGLWFDSEGNIEYNRFIDSDGF